MQRELNWFELRVAPIVEWASGRPFRPFSGPLDFLWRFALGVIAVTLILWGIWVGLNRP